MGDCTKTRKSGSANFQFKINVSFSQLQKPIPTPIYNVKSFEFDVTVIE